MKKLDRHFGYYQCSLCGKKKGALYGETGTIGSNCANVLRHTAGESHLRAWLADLPVEAEKPTLAELQTCVLLAVCPSIPTRGTLTLLSRRSQVDRAQVAGQRPLTAHHADQGAGAAQEKIATSAAVDAAVAAGRAAAGALTPVTPAATQLPPSYGVITPAAAAAWGAQMAAQAQAAAAQTAAATPTQTL